MSLYRNLLTGISYNFFAVLISRGLSIVVTVVLARILGPEEFGLYAFLLAIAMMMIPLADFGISGALQKYVHYFDENQTNVVVGCGFTGKLCSSFLIAVLVLVLDYFGGWFRGYGGYVALILFLSSFNLVVMSLNAELKFGQSALAQILMETIFVLMVAGVLVLGWPVTAVLVARGLSYLLIGLPFMLFVARPKWVSIKDEFDIFCKIIKFGFWATALVFFTVVFSQSGMVILSVLKGYEDTGILKAAVTIPTLIPLVSEVIRKPLFPIISSAAKKNRGKLDGQLLAMHKTITMTLLLIFIPVLSVGILFARQIITAVFGGQYVGAVCPFHILLIVNGLSAITISYYSFFYMRDKIKTLVRIGGVSATVSVVGNFILIPRFGLTGSALAMLRGQIVGTVWIIAAFNREYVVKI